jgi:hypothetical protein
MKQQSLRIILLSVAGYDLDRQDLERIQGEKFTSEALARTTFINGAFPFDTEVKILTASEFKKFHSRSKRINKDFDLALKYENTKHNYGLSEFMDDYNDEMYKGKTKDYWFGYIEIQ